MSERVKIQDAEPIMTDAQIKRVSAIITGKDLVDGKCVHCGHELQIGDYPFCP